MKKAQAVYAEGKIREPQRINAFEYRKGKREVTQGGGRERPILDRGVEDDSNQNKSGGKRG